MKYRNLGRTGLKVSEICLGAMTFGHTTDEAEATAIVNAAFDAGVNFIDTSNTYCEGRSEMILGNALKGRRDEVVLATKYFNPTGGGPNDSGSSRVHTIKAVEDSLQRLQTDHIDIYYLHHVDAETPLDETLRALDDLVRQGKVHYIACSNYEAWRLMEALWISDSKGWERFACYQPQYNMVVRDIEQDLIPICELKGLGVVVWGPMAGGFLTGKYRPGERVAKGPRSEENWVFMDSMFAASADATLTELLRLAEQLSCPPGALAIRWVLERKAITAAIVGARTADQFRVSLQAATLSPPAEALQKLEEVSRLPLRYPQAMEAGMRKRRSAAVKST
jgi:aryl-alcohol dehydrogenase-like predicted oxidoreductase